VIFRKPARQPSTRGFTIVELLIVIVVIAILAAISIVAYNGVQARANDSKMRAGVNQFEKALKLWVLDHPLPIRGGSGSTVAASNGTCTDGASGWLPSGTYVCSIDDALVSAGNLPSGFMLGMPRNTYYSAVTNGRVSTMFYGCGTGRHSLYWTLQNPTAEDSASIDDTLTTCGNPTTLRDTYGMRAGKILQF
jgi:prepilin-type N-terminal cleavage/methylation domain-containing protein